jgi:hypothetical protein
MISARRSSRPVERVSWPARLDDRSPRTSDRWRPARLTIDDLPAPGDEATLAEHRVEPLEQSVEGAGPDELLAEQPYPLASGTGSASESPANRMNESRSRSWYSA